NRMLTSRDDNSDDNMGSCYDHDCNLDHDRDRTSTTKSIAVTSTNDEFVDTKDHNSQVNNYPGESAQHLDPIDTSTYHESAILTDPRDWINTVKDHITAS
ncbi:17767_t:CDS:2, partial [Acaulospora morrowiae]